MSEPGDATPQRASSARPIGKLLALCAGLIAWAVQFTVIYGVTGIVCARGLADTRLFGIGIVPATVLAATALAFAATLVVFLLALRRHGARPPGEGAADRFLAHGTLLVSGLSLVIIAWHGLPALLLPPCW